MDLNLLISTVITATAALIAIIGGFLISRVITLSSEQNGIRRRLCEINIDITAKEKLLSEVEEYLLEKDREEFIDDYYSELIFDEIPLEILLESMGGTYRGRSATELEPAANELLQINTVLKSMFEAQEIHYSTDLPEDFRDFVTIASEDLEGCRSWYEMLYDEYQYQLPKRPTTGYSGTFLSDFDFTPPRLHNQIEAQTEAQAYQQKIRDRDTYRNELSYLIQQRTEQTKILEDYGKPSGMWGGLIVLVYASIVGIGYPVTLLPYPPQTYNDEATRRLILLLFLSQLLALFLYLGISMHSLTKDENTPDEEFEE